MPEPKPKDSTLKSQYLGIIERRFGDHPGSEGYHALPFEEMLGMRMSLKTKLLEERLSRLEDAVSKRSEKCGFSKRKKLGKQ